MHDETLRDVKKGHETTFTESVLTGGSVTRAMVDPSLKGTPEGNDFFTPKNAEEARTPLALLSGENTRAEVEAARKGVKELEIIGQVLAPGKRIVMSYEPLDEHDMTVADPKIGPVTELRDSEGNVHLQVEHTPSFLNTLKEFTSQNPSLREDGYFLKERELEYEGRGVGERR